MIDTGGGTAAEPAVRVPGGWLTALRELLSGLDGGSGRIAVPVEQYLLTGSPESAVDQVVAEYGAAQILFVQGMPVSAATLMGADHPLVAHAATLPMDVLYRWALLAYALLWPGAPRPFDLEVAGATQVAESLLIHLSHLNGGSETSVTAALPVDHELMERMLAAGGAPPAQLLADAFHPSSTRLSRFSVRAMNGYPAAIGRYPEVVHAALTSADLEQQVIALKMLEPLSADVLRPFAAKLADLATAPVQQLRNRARTPFARVADAELLKPFAVEGDPARRFRAFEQLWPLADGKTREWARARAAGDRSARVRTLVERWDRETADAASAAHEYEQSARRPERPVIDWAVPVTEKLMTALRQFWDQVKAEPAELDELVRAFEAGAPPARTKSDSRGREYLIERELLTSPLFGELSPVGLTILAHHFGLLVDDRPWLPLRAAELYEQSHRRTGHPTLLEVSTMLDEMGYDGPELVFAQYRLAKPWGEPLGVTWPDESVAPFVLANLDLVLTGVPIVHTYLDRCDPLRAYQALGTLSPMPPVVVDKLFALAVGSRTTDHEPAQQTLAKLPGLSDRVVAALKDGKADVRTAAAQWLGRLGDPAVAPALEAALQKENHDVTKGALLDVLQLLGQPIDKYFGHAAIVEQALAAKALPKSVDWLRWDAMPTVRWAESGDLVPVEVVKWLVGQGVKAKSPEPNVMLRKYCALFDLRDREALGLHLFEAWIAEDLTPNTPERALELAEEAARYAVSYLGGTSVPELTAKYLPHYQRQPGGSAIGAKGLLAVVAACGGEQLASLAGAYLKEWYGQRAAQGKALIAMLGWIDQPNATQLMLSIGSRFRTKSFQEEATKQAQALAGRKGWSIGDLADRTIPTAGFEDDGVIELSYGERVFTAVLRPDLTIELRSPEGKKLGSLPAARQSEDEELVKAAKKALTLARKELKAIVQLQGQRLYEALCIERTWPVDDWQRYLNGHPVVRYLTQRLAWVATAGEAVTVFRPLEDGTLTDVDDNVVDLPADAVIAIAHDSLLDEGAVKDWQAHLVDYEIVPLFQQFGKGVYVLPEELSAETEVTDFRGHLVEAFALRARTGKLGYARGQGQDGATFWDYEKRFPTLGLTVVVEFSGNQLPERNKTVALTTLSFRLAGEGGSRSTPRLGDIPAVLLSEAYNDLRLMAADGTGFDPAWEKTIGAGE
ncbi:DUF4132 domain-containing protein [Kribbella sp. NPDC051620]|uniref:DUF4132 domain-containing protein n=1 Tax=Kribbella sp. NPDC051620 TaxID=3364120 RepID=UPI0037A32BAD